MPRAKAVNHHYFDELNERSAWVLGFWAADGCVVSQKYGRCITFSQKNPFVLYTIRDELESEHKISGDSKLYYLMVNGKYLHDAICKIFGAEDMHRKSRVLTYPVNLPNHLFWDYLRGWFDGDGSHSYFPDVGVYRSSLACGSMPALIETEQKIREYTGMYGLLQTNKLGVHHLSYAGINAKILIYHLYENAILWCPYKKDDADRIARVKIGQVPRNLSDRTIELYPDFIHRSLAHGKAGRKSGYYGVRTRDGRRWEARAVNQYLGRYGTAEEAATAHDVAAKKILGPRALLNFA